MKATKAPEKAGQRPASESRLSEAELRQLAAIAADLGASPDFDHFLSRLCTHAADFCGFSRSFVALVDDHGCEIQCGFDSETPRAMRLRLDTLATRQVIATQQPFVSEKVGPEFGTSDDLLRMFGVGQLLAVPLVHRGEVVALLGLLDRADRLPIPPASVERAQALAAQVAVILQAVRNLQQSEQNRQRSEILVAMALELGSSLGLPDLVHSFTVRAASLLGARGAALSLTHGSVQECVVLEDRRLEVTREAMRELSTFFTAVAEQSSGAVQAMDAAALGALRTRLRWNELTLARLIGGTGELLGILCLVDCERKLTR
ncbi:MAG: GAF domain-containing protein, partial [Terriglobales bacterium]